MTPPVINLRVEKGKVWLKQDERKRRTVLQMLCYGTDLGFQWNVREVVDYRDIFASKNLENYDGIIGKFQLKDK